MEASKAAVDPTDISLSWRNYMNVKYDKEPFKTWDAWWKEALATGDLWAHNMYLGTCGADKIPQVRNVTLHLWDDEGFVFCTNSDGPKAKQLAENPKASVCLRWHDLDRQVRITGLVSKVSPAETEFLFRRCSSAEQIGFYALSHGKNHPYNQSNVEQHRPSRLIYLTETFKRYKDGDKPIPPPTAWSGYRLVPESIEFLGNERILWTKETKKEDQQSDGKEIHTWISKTLVN